MQSHDRGHRVLLFYYPLVYFPMRSVLVGDIRCAEIVGANLTTCRICDKLSGQISHPPLGRVTKIQSFQFLSGHSKIQRIDGSETIFACTKLLTPIGCKNVSILDSFRGTATISATFSMLARQSQQRLHAFLFCQQFLMSHK